MSQFYGGRKAESEVVPDSSAGPVPTYHSTETGGRSRHPSASGAGSGDLAPPHLPRTPGALTGGPSLLRARQSPPAPGPGGRPMPGRRSRLRPDDRRPAPTPSSQHPQRVVRRGVAVLHEVRVAYGLPI